MIWGTSTRPSQSRLLGVDGARGLALLGMMSVHVMPSMTPSGEVSTAYLISSGRASALFAVLAGVGLALATGRQVPPHGRALRGIAAATTARAMLLLLIGLTIGAMNSGVAVILAYYSLLFLVAVPFLGLRPTVLLPLAVVWAVVTPILSHALRPSLPEPLLANPTLATLADPVQLLSELSLTGYYPVLPWTAYLLLGLGIGRLDLRRIRVSWTLLLVGGIAAVASQVISSWLLAAGGLAQLETTRAAELFGRPLEIALETSLYGTTPTSSWWWLAVAAPHSGTPFDLLHTMGTAAAVLGLMLLVMRRLRIPLWPLAAIGGMTLTLYTLHVVLLGSLLPRTTPDALLWHVVIAFAVAVPWKTVATRGPLEDLAHQTSTSVRLLVDGVRKPTERTDRPQAS